MSNDTPPGGSSQAPGDGYWMMVIERLARIEITVEGIRRDRDEMVKYIDKGREDHETRIRKLEERKFPLPTISVITAILALAMAVLTYLNK